MTILDLTAHLGACHDCGARIDARGVFCAACITADEVRRSTPASSDRTPARVPPSGVEVRSENGEASPDRTHLAWSAASTGSRDGQPAGLSPHATNAGAVNTGAVETTTA